MPSCFAPGCKTGYVSANKRNKALGIRNPTLFAPPKDEELLKRWHLAIRRKDRTLTSRDRLCEKHFSDDCIVRNYETKLPDGSTWVYERGIPQLVAGSIPTIFSYMAKSSSSSEKKKRKLRAVRTSVSRKKQPISVDAISEEYEEFVSNISNVTKPNNLWTVSKNENFIICAKWVSDYTCERHVIVLKDFSVKIFLRTKEITISNVTIVKDVAKLAEILIKVDKILICEDIENRKSQCLGLVEKEGPVVKRKHLRCTACAEIQIKENNGQRKKKLSLTARKKKKKIN